MATADARLIEALLQGHEGAFTSLFEQHQRALLRLAVALVENRAVAEEVVQETWAGVIEGLSRFQRTVISEDMGLPNHDS